MLRVYWMNWMESEGSGLVSKHISVATLQLFLPNPVVSKVAIVTATQ